jgi:hypothetical protein
MSKAEILQELEKLTPQEREEVRLRLAELEGDDWLDDGTLTEAEKTLIEARFRDLEANPHTSLSWAKAKEQIMAPFTR